VLPVRASIPVRAWRGFGHDSRATRGQGTPPSPPRGRLAPIAALVAVVVATRAGEPLAHAEEPAPPARDAAPHAPGDAAAELRALMQPPGIDKRIFASLEFGGGFRFNNPYRLATELGSTAQSVSLTASYADLGVGATFGAADGLQHGAAVHASFAMVGVPQAVITPTYLAAYRGPNPFLVYGRAGPSIIVTPDPTGGIEVAAGFAWFVTGKLAIASELVFDVYYGEGTHHVAIATYPILSGQLGLLFEHEFLQ
jgi:hypothetical protein